MNSLKIIKNSLFLSFCLLSLTCLAQENFVLAKVSNKNNQVLRVKWYSKNLIYPNGVNIYRQQEGNSEWQKINSTPIKKGDYKISSSDLSSDKELTEFTNLANNMSNFKGIPLLAIYIKSFKSEAFSKYLGIQFDDNTTKAGVKYKYQIKHIDNDGIEKELGVSTQIQSNIYTTTESPKEISIIPKNKKCIIKWLPETSRYYSVDIYKKTNDNPTEKKINAEPIVISKTKGKNGVYQYPEKFFIDDKVKEDSTYYYLFKAIDFFGEESLFSEPFKVFLKDIQAPSAPIYSGRKIKSKNVTLSWRKKIIEPDFIGYNIYRTPNNDTNYKKVNSQLISKIDTSYTDEVDDFKLYNYFISAIDKDGNEGYSNLIKVDVFDDVPPQVPKNLKLKSDTGKIILTWDKNPENDLWGYFIYRTINKNKENYVLITPSPIATNQYIDKLPDNAKNKFLYKVLAIDKAYNKSGYSDFATASLPDIYPPLPPFIKTYFINEKKQAVIEWVKNAEKDLKGYDLFKTIKKNEETNTEKVNVNLIEASLYRYIDRDVDEGTSVSYYLIAYDSMGNASKKSNTVKLSFRKVNTIEKTTFTKVKANGFPSKRVIEVKWSVLSTENLTYIVFCKKDGEKNFSPVSGNIEDENYKISNALKGHIYTIQIRAYNNIGLVAKSEIVEVQVSEK
jgi:hypothetical protein